VAVAAAFFSLLFELVVVGALVAARSAGLGWPLAGIAGAAAGVLFYRALAGLQDRLR
jgi:hypothetical protein